jgi:hypothetical protein
VRLLPPLVDRLVRDLHHVGRREQDDRVVGHPSNLALEVNDAGGAAQAQAGPHVETALRAGDERHVGAVVHRHELGAVLARAAQDQLGTPRAFIAAAGEERDRGGAAHPPRHHAARC